MLSIVLCPPHGPLSVAADQYYDLHLSASAPGCPGVRISAAHVRPYLQAFYTHRLCWMTMGEPPWCNNMNTVNILIAATAFLILLMVGQGNDVATTIVLTLRVAISWKARSSKNLNLFPHGLHRERRKNTRSISGLSDQFSTVGPIVWIISPRPCLVPDRGLHIASDRPSLRSAHFGAGWSRPVLERRGNLLTQLFASSIEQPYVRSRVAQLSAVAG